MRLGSAGDSYAGTTTVTAGTLQADGTTRVTSVTGGTLAGTGTTGSITATGGTVAPGDSPGTLSTGNNGTGDVSLNGSTLFNVELNGTAAGSFDVLNVFGAVSLGNATLNVSLGFTPAVGNTFPIITNDGGDGITGIFNGLPEGGYFMAGGQPFTISYVGGDGNDVALKAMACFPLTVTRNGGGSFPAGIFNAAYPGGNSVIATGGSGTYSYAITAGSLPTSMSLDTNTGAITGTPSATGTFAFTVTATDTNATCAGVQSFSIAVSP
jgi:hypothetical protein